MDIPVELQPRKEEKVCPAPNQITIISAYEKTLEISCITSLYISGNKSIWRKYPAMGLSNWYIARIRLWFPAD